MAEGGEGDEREQGVPEQGVAEGAGARKVVASALFSGSGREIVPLKNGKAMHFFAS